MGACGCQVGQRAYQLYRKENEPLEAEDGPLLTLHEFLADETLKAPYRERARQELGRGPCHG